MKSRTTPGHVLMGMALLTDAKLACPGKEHILPDLPRQYPTGAVKICSNPVTRNANKIRLSKYKQAKQRI